MAGQVILDSAGAIAVVLLSHPGKLGAMSRGMWRELKVVFERIQREPRWRCVLVRGDPGAFSAGGDIAEYPEFRFDPARLREFHEHDVWGGLRAMLDCDVPMVALIEGACMGAGMEIASCCDIRVASVNAKFGAPIARLGFPMAPREARLVASAAGMATAREMLLEAAVLDTAQMKARGFLHEVVAEGEAATRVRQRCERIALLAPQAARMNKRTFRALAAGGMPPDAYDYAPGAEHREGIAAFLEKRQPVF
ncbi:enoyl-CoA hydratase/isomerase family protein [Ramlibacter sp.]|uniref:enoyl-CoA hydratase/isomerase family protein n=1 Tax=Ramlibacter sp. TaxID=1917967 RepID=UPI00179ED2D0|nr:enoyl-CoA hydratase/isomerase family protein [Ramlibacter sp.]MBA2672517.1 enoyl-CoA hydratase/isomerase family protein [Ramlibacter sp.]